MERKKGILIIILLALAIPLLCISTIHQNPTTIPNITQQSNTAKLPTLDNLTYQVLTIELSALDRKTAVYTLSQFNQSFFDPQNISAAPNLLTARIGLQVFVSPNETNATAPHLSPQPSMIMASVMVVINGTDDAARTICNNLLQILSNDLQTKLQSLLGLNFYKISQTTQSQYMSMPSWGANTTVGLIGLMCSGDPNQVYNQVRNLLPEGSLVNIISQKTDNTTKTIMIFDVLDPSTDTDWNSGSFLLAIFDNQITGTGYPYAYSLRTLIQPPSGSNITLSKDTYISILLPVTAKILGCYPQTAQSGPTSIYLSSWNEPLNVYDLNVSYRLEAETSVPNVAVLNYSLSPTIPDPGTTANLTLKIKNVGTTAAYNITIRAQISDTTVMNFTNGYTWNNGASIEEYITDKLDPGQIITHNISITTKNTGKTVIQISEISWAREANGPKEHQYLLSTTFEVGVGSINSPLLVTTAEFSPWSTRPDLFSIVLTVRNDGTDTAENVKLYPYTTIIDSNATLAHDDSTNMDYFDLGNISIGSEKTINFTTITGSTLGPLHDMIRTGGFYSIQFILVYDEGVVSGGLGPLLVLPGFLPPDAPCFVEVSKTPDVVTVSQGSYINVSITAKNLGQSKVSISIWDSYPIEMFNLSWGNINATSLEIDPGCSVTISYGLVATKPGTVKLPPTTASLSTLLLPPVFYSGVNLIGTPLSFCNQSLVLSSGGFSVDFTEVAGLEVAGYASGPLNFTVWNDTQPPGGNPPSGVTPLGYLRLECNASIPLTLKFHYDVLGVTDDEADRLVVYVWNGSEWVSLSSTVDKVNNVIIVEVPHLSYFALGLRPPMLDLLLLLLLVGQPSFNYLLLVGGVVAAIAVLGVAAAVVRRRRAGPPAKGYAVLRETFPPKPREPIETPVKKATTCPFCGAPVTPGQVTCSKCGAVL
ncbi:MAG: hypothetical protein QW279_02365 [Candidatus Jordarchaeaceae archaeon]